MSNEKEMSLDAVISIFVVGLIVGAVLAVYFLGSIYVKNWSGFTRRFVQTQPIVTLSPGEVTALTSAKAAYSMGETRPLNMWLEKLAKEKRWGRLPSLPATYSNDLIFEFEGDMILLPKPAKE